MSHSVTFFSGLISGFTSRAARPLFVLAACLIAACGAEDVTLAASPDTAHIVPEKSPNDDREYGFWAYFNPDWCEGAKLYIRYGLRNRDAFYRRLVPSVTVWRSRRHDLRRSGSDDPKGRYGWLLRSARDVYTQRRAGTSEPSVRQGSGWLCHG